MTKKLLSLFIIITLLCGTSYTVSAANPQDTITKNKLKFQQMNDRIMETNNQISSLNLKISKLNKEIDKNNKDISENKRLIDNEKIHMNQLIKEVNTTQELANRRLRALYINGNSKDYIVVLLTSEGFADFLSKYESIKSIISFDKKTFNNLSERKKALNESISSLDNKNQKLSELKDSNAESLRQLNETKKQFQDLAKQFDKEKNAAAMAIKENEESLIAHSISAIDSQSSTISDVKSALGTLNNLLPQISTDSVKKKAKDYIALGNTKLANLIATSTVPDAGSGDIYKATYTMEATAYTGGSITALGLKPVRDPANLSTIAVDPAVIPLGTKVYIPGYGYAICSDTGGAIKGNIIDLYMNSEDDCLNWGRRQVTLNIIAYPGEW